MNNRFDQFSPFLFMGIMVVGIACAAYYVWRIFNPASDFSAEDAPAIARYKEMVQKNDMPLVGGKIKPQELPAVCCKIIEFDVKNGDRKSARSFIATAQEKKIDDQLETLAQLPQAKELIGRMRDGRRKIEALQGFIAAIPKRSKQRPDPDLVRLAGQFTAIPFHPLACPEQAEEINRIYQERLRGIKGQDEAIDRVIVEVEKNCRRP